MPRLSVVVPWVGANVALEDTLASILQHLPPQSEVLVPHPGPYDDPYDLCGEVRFLEAPVGATATELICLAADEAEGDYLHLVRGGLRVEEGWTEPALAVLADETVAAVIPAVVDLHGNRLPSGLTPSAAGGRLATADETPRAPLPQTGFFRLDAWDDADGLDPAAGGLAELDLTLTLQTAGYEVVFEPRSRLRSETAPTLAGDPLSGLYAERLYWRHPLAMGSAAAHWTAVTWEWLSGGLVGSAWTRLRQRLKGAADGDDRAAQAHRVRRMEGPETTFSLDDHRDDAEISPQRRAA